MLNLFIPFNCIIFLGGTRHICQCWTALVSLKRYPESGGTGLALKKKQHRWSEPKKITRCVEVNIPYKEATYPTKRERKIFFFKGLGMGSSSSRVLGRDHLLQGSWDGIIFFKGLGMGSSSSRVLGWDHLLQGSWDGIIFFRGLGMGSTSSRVLGWDHLLQGSWDGIIFFKGLGMGSSSSRVLGWDHLLQGSWDGIIFFKGLGMGSSSSRVLGWDHLLQGSWDGIIFFKGVGMGSSSSRVLGWDHLLQGSWDGIIFFKGLGMGSSSSRVLGWDHLLQGSWDGIIFFKGLGMGSSSSRALGWDILCYQEGSHSLGMVWLLKHRSESRGLANSHVLVYHGPWVSHLLGVAPSTFQGVYVDCMISKSLCHIHQCCFTLFEFSRFVSFCRHFVWFFHLQIISCRDIYPQDPHMVRFPTFSCFC